VNGDVTLPLIYALRSPTLTEMDRGKLLRAYEEGRPIEVEEVRRIYTETNALSKSVEKMRLYAEGCIDALKDFNPSPPLECLLHLVERYYLNLEV
ncbi:hypothetical protein CW701_00740, partial [Candidatus Bathyarchaeota archaeon]